jgi:catechol 2,3-dioxygenase
MPVHPIRDVAHVGYVELLTPVLDESIRFFVDVLGMDEVERADGASYLRAFGDYERFTLKLTASDRSGVGTTGLRAASPEALQARVAAVAATPHGGEWSAGEPGRGDTYHFADPDGHPMALYFDSAPYEAPADRRPTLKNQPQKLGDRGVGVRRLDHVNFRCLDVDANCTFVRDVLGFRMSEQIVTDEGDRQLGAWLHVTQKSYDIAYGGLDKDGMPGRLHHVAYFVDNREYVLRAADIFLDAGAFIEVGPAKHTIQQTFFLYVYEPGGNRIEIISDTRLIFAPDHEPVTWTATERKRGQAWKTIMPQSWFDYATPADELPVEAGVR